MAQVYSLSQKKIIEVPDDPTMQSGGMDVQEAVAPPPQNTQPAKIDTATPEQPKTITGRTIEEHAQALNMAKSAGDTNAIKQITDDYKREYDYQKEFINPVAKAQADEGKKKAEGDKNIKGLLNTLEELKGDAAQIGLSNIPGSIARTDSKLQQFETKRSLAAQFLAKAVENGRLSDKDRLFYQKIVGIDPYGFTSPKNEQIDALIDTISSLTGVERTSPRSESNVGMDVLDAVKGVGNFMLGGAKNVVQDSVAGIIANITEPQRKAAAESAMSTAGSLEQQAQAEQDPTKKKALMQQAQQIYTNISEGAQNVSETFSEDVQGNPFLRGVEAGAQIAGTAEVIANPAIVGNMVKAPFQAVRHPLDTLKTAKQAITHPIDTAKTIVKNDWEQTKKGWNPLNQPKTGGGAYSPDDLDNAIAADIKSQPEPVLNTSEDSLRDKLANEFSTAIGVIDDGSVIKSENTMREALRMTKGGDPRSVARELEEIVPKAEKAIEAHVANIDAQVGLQPLDGETGIIKQIVDHVRRNSTAARANPQMLTQLERDLQQLLYAGDMGEDAMRQGFIQGTNFQKLNETRKYFTSGKNGWFRSNQPVGTPTNDLNDMEWAAANAIKDIMSEGDPTVVRDAAGNAIEKGVFGKMLQQQHVALQTYPVLSKEALNREPVRSVGGMIRRGYETARDRLTLGSVERGTKTVPNIQVDDTIPPASGQMDMLENPPSNTPPAISDPTAPSSSVGTGERLGGQSYVNTAGDIREVTNAKGKVIGLEKRGTDGKWVEYKSSVRNFKKVDSAPQKSVNGGMSIDDATLRIAPATGEPRATNARFEKDGRSLMDYNNDELTLDELQNKLELANQGWEGKTYVKEIEDEIDRRLGAVTKTDMLPESDINSMPNAEKFVREYKNMRITSKGADADIEYLARKAMADSDYAGLREYWTALPDGNDFKEGMRSLMEKQLRHVPISKKK